MACTHTEAVSSLLVCRRALYAAYLCCTARLRWELMLASAGERSLCARKELIVLAARPHCRRFEARVSGVVPRLGVLLASCTVVVAPIIMARGFHEHADRQHHLSS